VKLVELYAEIARMHRDGVNGVVATVVTADGSTPRGPGAKMIVYADGRTLGTVGGGAVESRVIERARALAGERTGPRDPVLLSFDLGPDLAMACGGRMEVLLEPVAAAARAVVIGGGHCGQAIAALARQAGFRVTVVDDREDIVTAERFPGAERRVIGGVESLGALGIDAESFVVVVTRGHRFDQEWLKAVLPLGPRYLGMIGSENKVRSSFADLARDGVPAAALERVHAPVGLDIGAETPDEIAVSVVAEMIAVKHGVRDTAMLRDKPGKKGKGR
jgi:xanthine dehydrogenase accessory factor